VICAWLNQRSEYRCCRSLKVRIRSPRMPRRARVCCQESSSSKLKVYILRAEEATLDGGDNLRFPSCDPAQSAGPRKIGQGKRISKRTYDYLLHGKEPANERGHTVPGTWLIEEHSAAAKEVSRAAKLAAAGGAR
jgi:hypothetical protein